MPDPLERLSAALSDRYRIERQLGAGGMATVYLAEDLKHKRRVALKVLRPELAAVLGAERFVQEITTTASLQHPHILPLYDSGSVAARPDSSTEFLYYVMPYIQGETVREKLSRETQLGIEEAVRITTEVADALEYAHQQGVVHRDIKPENILLQGGRAMVADFGIALAVSAAAGGRMTETGLSLGTPHYMSPEQATAEKNVTARSDVYSLGCVLYEMLTGDPPHTASSVQAIILKIVTDQARPVTDLRKSVPPNVAAAVAKALEKLPADRFTTAAEFGAALQNPAFTTAPSTRPPVGRTGVPPARRSAVVPGLAAAAVLAAGLAAWGWMRPLPEPSTTREWVGLSLVRPGGVLPAFWPSDLAISRDGSAIVFGDSVDDRGTWQLLLKEQGNPTVVPIPGTDGAFNPFFSPDGAWIGFATERGLYRVPRSGGAPVKLSDSTGSLATGVYSSGVWLDDGTIVFAARDSRHLFRIDAEGGGERVVLAGNAWPPHAIVRLEALPRSRGVLMTSCAASPCTRGGLWMLDLERDTLFRLLADVSAGWYLPTGHVLYGRADGTLFAQALDIEHGTLTGRAVSVMTGLATTSGVPALAVSPAGTALYALRNDATAPGRGSSIVSVDRDGTVSVLDADLSLPGVEQTQIGLSLTPDDGRLALVQNTDEGSQIYVKRMPDGPVTRLTFESWNGRPVWTADGRDLVYVRYRAGAPSIAVRQRADGTGAATVIAEEERPIAETLLSPDGEWLVYRTESTASGNGDILARRLSGDSATVPLFATAARELAPAISADGRWLAYTTDEGGTSEVVVRPWPDVSAGRWQVSRDGGTAPLWSRDGTELFFVSSRQELMVAEVENAPTFGVRSVRPLWSVSGYLVDGFHAAYAVSRDGQRFLFGRQAAPQDGAAKLILVRHWFTELRPLLEGN